MYDKQIRPGRKVTFNYTRVCIECEHREVFKHDGQKCEECGTTTPPKVKR